jgi:hypothetical protein
MIKFIKNQSLRVSAIVTLSMLSGADKAFAEDAVNFSTISGNVSTSIASLPGLLAGVSYMIGILLGVLGILKIKDHVENPTQTPLQHGAIRLVAGGGLFALPIVFEAMQGTVQGEATAGEVAPTLTAIGDGLR